jgi:hypothetical protein
MPPLTKLPTVLPQLVGKTVERTMLVVHPDSRSQLWLFFTDGTSYEFYAESEIGGARRPSAMTVEGVFCSVSRPGVGVLLAPDRRKGSRGS